MPAPFLALVTWHDAHGDATQTVWELAQAEHSPLVVETLGWVTRDDDVGVTMFQERIDQHDGTFTWRARGFIPRGMVVSVVPLVGAPPPPKRRKKAA
jgi:hypothetical protein